MSEERDFKGIWIPAEVWLSRELTLQEKVFFCEIDSLDNENGCFASNAYFAEFFGVTKQRASQVINSLIEKRYLAAKYKYNGTEVKKRVLRVSNKFDTLSNLCEKGIKKSLKGYQENAKDNNISNNINNKDKASRFAPPSPEEVQAYLNDKNITAFTGQYFCDYNAARGWMLGKNKMKDWRAACRGWAARNYGEPKKKSVAERLRAAGWDEEGRKIK